MYRGQDEDVFFDDMAALEKHVAEVGVDYFDANARIGLEVDLDCEPDLVAEMQLDPESVRVVRSMHLYSREHYDPKTTQAAIDTLQKQSDAFVEGLKIAREVKPLNT